MYVVIYVWETCYFWVGFSRRAFHRPLVLVIEFRPHSRSSPVYVAGCWSGGPDQLFGMKCCIVVFVFNFNELQGTIRFTCSCSHVRQQLITPTPPRHHATFRLRQFPDVSCRQRWVPAAPTQPHYACLSPWHAGNMLRGVESLTGTKLSTIAEDADFLPADTVRGLVGFMVWQKKTN